MLREPETSIFTRLDQILDLTSKKTQNLKTINTTLLFFFFLSKYGEYVRISLIFQQKVFIFMHLCKSYLPEDKDHEDEPDDDD